MSNLQVTPPQLLSAVVLFVILLLQLFPPVPPSEELPWTTDTHLHKNIPPPTCTNTPIFQSPLPVSGPAKMALLDAARKVAAEFEYSPEDVNRGVKAFLDQMSRHLQETGHDVGS